MRLALIAALALAPLTAAADAARAVAEVILPGVVRFEAAAADLARVAGADCQAVRPGYHRAFDAWTAVADIRIGPGEAAPLGIAFWPDERGSGAKALARLIAEDSPVTRDPAAYAQVSAAARGFSALDLLLGDPALSATPLTCALVATVAADLAAQAADLRDGWQAYAPLLARPGSDGNLTFLDEAEARRAIYTQILGGLTLTADSRLARPLGSFDRPRPTRAEAWRTGRALPNAVGYARAAHALVTALADAPLPLADAALAAVEEAAAVIADPGLAGVADPTERLKVEILQQRILALRQAIETELGAPLGIAPGFNAADGD